MVRWDGREPSTPAPPTIRRRIGTRPPLEQCASITQRFGQDAAADLGGTRSDVGTE
ncbi:hypothetical protein ACLI4Q_01255 [Natrialbaceae archaeon A-CW1-1]